MDILHKYAHLLVHYCLELQPGQSLFIQSTTLAQELIREIYKEAIKVGAHVEVDLTFRGKNKIFLGHADDGQLKHVSPLRKYVIENFDAYLFVRAPFNLREDANIDPQKRTLRSTANKELNQIFSKRTAEGSLTRSLCQFPTQASAQEAGMSLEEYQRFVFSACHLYDENPATAWRKIRTQQQRYVDRLNKTKKVRYIGPKTDVSFSVEGRTWINSDGRVNMPSGEVFSGPIEDSVNGHVFFDYPSIYNGREVSGIYFEIVDGYIQNYSAQRGQEVLDEIMKIDGARYFGEVAIGTNYNISINVSNFNNRSLNVPCLARGSQRRILCRTCICSWHQGTRPKEWYKHHSDQAAATTNNREA